MIYLKDPIELASLPDTVPEDAYPEATDIWKPIPHRTLAQAVIKGAEDEGIGVTRSRWDLCRKENGLIGILDVEMPDGFSSNTVGLQLGVRHSNDAAWALTFLVGATVFICSNGVISAEFIVKRKHTSGVDLTQVIHDGIDRYKDLSHTLMSFMGALQNFKMPTVKGDSMILETCLKDIIPWRFGKDIAREWRKPTHEEFKDRTAWSLYNCMTHVVKERRNPIGQMESISRLREVFRPALSPVNTIM